MRENVIDDFERITGYKLREFLTEYAEFVEKERRAILQYYQGASRNPNREAFAKLNQLIEESINVLQSIQLNKSRMTDVRFWDLLDKLEQIHESLLTTDNSSKWMRSSITKNNFTPEVEVTYTTNQLETLEKISEKFGSNDRDQDWSVIALRNDLSEEMYDLEGGLVVTAGRSSGRTIQLQSVIDNISDEKAYGLDFDKKLTFVDDDLSVLSYKETVLQAIDILINLRRGQNPEFVQDGIQAGLVGSNRASISYSILYRQLYSTFQKDDTLKSLKITKVLNEEDALTIDFTVETRVGEEIEKQTTL